MGAFLVLENKSLDKDINQPYIPPQQGDGDMANTFDFRGGSHSPRPGEDCKFLLFLVVGGREIPFGDSCRQGLIKNKPGVGYETQANVVKIFNLEQGPKVPRFVHSFYLRLGVWGEPQTVTIKPRHTIGSWFFTAQASFMSQKDTLAVLTPGEMSYEFAKSARTPSIDILRQMITIKRPRHIEERKEVRKLRII